MIKTLVEDKRATEKKFELVLRTIGETPADAPPGYVTVPESTKEGNLQATSSSLAASSGTGQDWKAFAGEPAAASPFPVGLLRRKEEIEDHTALVKTLLEEASAKHYKIDHGQRHRMHEGILHVHWKEWSPLRKLYGDQLLSRLFSSHYHVVSTFVFLLCLLRPNHIGPLIHASTLIILSLSRKNRFWQSQLETPASFFNFEDHIEEIGMSGPTGSSFTGLSYQSMSPGCGSPAASPQSPRNPALDQVDQTPVISPFVSVQSPYPSMLATYPQAQPLHPSITAHPSTMANPSTLANLPPMQPLFPSRLATYPSMQSYGTHMPEVSDFDEDDNQKGKCPHSDCGRVFKDLKAHMFTHQAERTEKCPLSNCEYNQQGFARKYDKNRHILTHYKGVMVCSFCPGHGSAEEKSFNRSDVFKRHLTSVHGVEQTPPNSRKRNPTTAPKLNSDGGIVAGKCSTCSIIFANAQAFYDHLDDCVVRVVQREASNDLPKKDVVIIPPPGLGSEIPDHNTGVDRTSPLSLERTGAESGVVSTNLTGSETSRGLSADRYQGDTHEVRHSRKRDPPVAHARSQTKRWDSSIKVSERDELQESTGSRRCYRACQSCRQR